MSESALQQLIRETSVLSADEQLRLAAYLVEQARQSCAPRRGRKWLDLCGIAPDILDGEDAQEWVSRNRRAADEHREKQWQR